MAFTYRPAGTPPDETLAAIERAGQEGFAFPADHAVRGQTQAAVAAVQARFGRLDAFVHAAGPIVVRRFAASTFADYETMLAANLGSAVEGAFAVLPGMRERAFGRLVFFGMNGSHATLPAAGMTLYGAAKAAVVTFARALALEEARHGITVNAIEPGDIRDKELDRFGASSVPAANPTGHAGSWEDIAAAVRFYLSDDAGFINGQTIGVNGGLVEPHER